MNNCFLSASMFAARLCENSLWTAGDGANYLILLRKMQQLSPVPTVRRDFSHSLLSSCRVRRSQPPPCRPVAFGAAECCRT